MWPSVCAMLTWVKDLPRASIKPLQDWLVSDFMLNLVSPFPLIYYCRDEQTAAHGPFAAFSDPQFNPQGAKFPMSLCLSEIVGAHTGLWALF